MCSPFVFIASDNAFRNDPMQWIKIFPSETNARQRLQEDRPAPDRAGKKNMSRAARQ
jgi:hypothetical protein